LANNKNLFTLTALFLTIKSENMSLPVNNKNGGKAGGKDPKGGMGQGSKFIAKPGTKATGVTKKPIKTGGSRGS
jgi:hypothetical protein